MATEQRTYHIRVEGHLGESWSPWLQGMTIHHQDTGETVLTGTLRDQAALHGVLIKIRDLGLALVEITTHEAGGAPGDTAGSESTQ